jgi:hypothetical protein
MMGRLRPSAMDFAIDHVFVLCSAGAPEADALARAGFREGSGLTHPGQGTANRRFFFQNAYLELLWVSDAEEARREPASRTRLWERWSERQAGASPFGIIFRAQGSASLDPPFPTWSYRPPYSEVAIDVACDTPLGEPELFYFRFARRPGALSEQPTAHALPPRSLTGLSVAVPAAARSKGARAAEATGLVTFRTAAPLMTLEFDGRARGQTMDLRPELPLVLAW